MSNFSKIESYTAEAIYVLANLGIDHTPYFPLPKTLSSKVINRNKGECCLTFGDTSDRKKLRGLWQHMIDRCHDPKNRSFKTHGDKGTEVCKEWRENFDEFHDWAVSNGYKFGLSLDRIKNEVGYQSDNCRWSNHTVQARNRSNLKKYEVFGESLLLIELAEHKKCVVSYDCLRSRIKSKWEIEKAATTPSKIKKTTSSTKSTN